MTVGGGAQTHPPGRWGDYSMTTIDPADNKTFWHVNEYYPTTSNASWATRIGKFNFVRVVPCANKDFNGDCKADILWQNTSTGQRVIWLMNGTTFQSFVSFATVDTSWSIAGSGDFNGDGKADILWQNTITGQRVIWLMNGTTFQSFVSFATVDTSWSIAGSGDFNGDGKADIIWQNTVTGQRVIWLMNGTTFQSFVSFATVDTSWSIAGSGDFNGDGKADILWQNTVTGQRVIWLMNGTTFQSFVSLATVADIVEHRWFGRLQRGRQGGHSLAKHRYRPARNLAHEWHHVSILCQFRNGRYIVEHQKSLTDSAINRHCFDRLRIVFPQLNQSIYRITTPSGTPTNTTRQPASPHGSRALASLTSWE